MITCAPYNHESDVINENLAEIEVVEEACKMSKSLVQSMHTFLQYNTSDKLETYLSSYSHDCANELNTIIFINQLLYNAVVNY